MVGAPQYEIYAVRYAHNDRLAAQNFVDGEKLDLHDTRMPLDYFVWAIVGPGGPYIVDTGFDEAMGRVRKREILKPIGECLKAIGIEPETVENVIISHLHFDHAGNHELFPQARYHLQDCEMNFATGRCMCEARGRAPFEVDDVVAMVRKVFAGRVVFHDGESQVASGISVHKIGGHSKGLQCVRVNTRRGPVVLASDASHLYVHFENDLVFPVFHDADAVVKGYKTLKALAPSLNHIIPGHDPEVLRRYPAAKPGLENWVARIDADPLHASR